MTVREASACKQGRPDKWVVLVGPQACSVCVELFYSNFPAAFCAQACFRGSLRGRRGGLIKWADLVGPKHVAARLAGWAQQFAGAGLGGFFRPCEYLAKAAAEGTALSAGVPAPSRM